MSALPTRNLAPLLQPAADPADRSPPLTRLEQLRLQLAASPHAQVLKNGALLQRSTPEQGDAPFAFERLAGRLVELLDAQPAARAKPHFADDVHARASTSARDARTSWVAARLAEAQALGETVAWIIWEPRGIPYPPDLAGVGLDLRALPLVVVQSGAQVLRAADLLLRSGAFGLVAADWPTGEPPPGDGALGRLLGLCQKHDAALLFLSQPMDIQDESMGSDGSVLRALASLRLRVARVDLPGGSFELTTTVLKDKRRGVAPPVREPRQAPEGLGAGAKRL